MCDVEKKRTHGVPLPSEWLGRGGRCKTRCAPPPALQFKTGMSIMPSRLVLELKIVLNNLRGEGLLIVDAGSAEAVGVY